MTELVAAVARNGERLAAFATRIPIADHQRLLPGEFFSVTGHYAHLRDVERGAHLHRIRLITASDDPALEDFDGGAVAKASRYDLEDGRAAFAAFVTARAETVRVLAELPAAAFDRPAHFGLERVTLASVVRDRIVAHDEEHLAELERIATALGH